MRSCLALPPCDIIHICTSYTIPPPALPSKDARGRAICFSRSDISTTARVLSVEEQGCLVLFWKILPRPLPTSGIIQPRHWHAPSPLSRYRAGRKDRTNLVESSRIPTKFGKMYSEHNALLSLLLPPSHNSRLFERRRSPLLREVVISYYRERYSSSSRCITLPMLRAARVCSCLW